MEDLWESLLACCRKYPSMLAAFSGGVDSTLLARAARDSGVSVRLAFCRNQLSTAEEERAARALARWLELPMSVVEVDALALPEVAQNQRDRCYACKRALFFNFRRLADEWGLSSLADGTNADDLSAGNRPGSRACLEFKVAQPLAEAGLTKAEVRQLAAWLGLPNHDKPAWPCLATRFPYGTELTKDLLKKVADGERLLAEAGLTEFRLRSHGEICRIEAGPRERELILSRAPELRQQLLALGWHFVTLDLGGLVSGGFDRY